jgi:uncharacterized membrane protein YhaH (DUF805 family)
MENPLKCDRATKWFALAYTVNLLVPLVFSSLIFSNCATPRSEALNLASIVCLTSASLAPLLCLLKITSKRRLNDYLQSGKALMLCAIPMEVNPTSKWIVDKTHAMVIGSQLVNFSLACAAGGLLITQQCSIKARYETVTSGILMIIFHVGYVALAVKAGGSIRF